MKLCWHDAQVLVLLEDFNEPAPEGAELEAFLASPKHHLARLVRDLFSEEAAATTLEVTDNILTDHYLQ